MAEPSLKEWRNTLVVVTTIRSLTGDDAGGAPTVGGYAAVFNTPSRNLGGFKETIAPGAFNRARSQNWIDSEGVGVVARFNHNDDDILGTTANNTLRLGIDHSGLAYEVTIDSRSTRAMDRYYAIERGDVRQSSFAFVADDDEWAADDTGFPHRTVTQARLYDVAPVVTPAYADTTVGLRSLARAKDAAFEDITKLAKEGELRKLFVRTDTVDPKVAQRRSAQAALAAVLALDPNATL